MVVGDSVIVGVSVDVGLIDEGGVSDGSCVTVIVGDGGIGEAACIETVWVDSGGSVGILETVVASSVEESLVGILHANIKKIRRRITNPGTFDFDPKERCISRLQTD